MKYISIFILFTVFISCSDVKKDQPREEMQQKFETAWNSGSEVDIKRIRSEIAVTPVVNEFSLYCRAWLLAKSGNYPKAIVTADSLVMGFPTFEKGLYLRANLRYESKDEAGALGDFDKAIKRKPDFFEALMNRGNLHFKNQHPDLALNDFLSALKVKPDNSEVRLNIGNSRFALGQQDSACFSWKQAELLGNEKAIDLQSRFCRTTKK
jgi:tetratricopeptide (TPR) repeat protein